MHVNFWNKRYEFHEVRKPLRVINNFFDIVQEQDEESQIKTLEIHENDFQKNY